jgi:L-lactate dehydrogenase
VSSLVEGHYGIDGVCLSLPAVIDRGGVRRVLPLPLSPEETNRLHHSASAVATMAAAAGLNAPPAQA